MLAISIDEELLKLTDCPKNYCCLEKSCDVCEVGMKVKNSLMMEHQKSGSFACNFKEHFASSHLCTCPIRLEIYKQTGD